jgi:nucleoside 2-deoxyribosyltransferase
MKIYLAGPLFSPAQRGFLGECARTFREAGLECFVPHEMEARLGAPSARGVFDLDYREGLATANALVAWLDGPTVDDGTACEIGIFYGLLQQGVAWRKGILGLATDLRLERRREVLEHGGLNLFVAGTIQDAGSICWSVEEILDRLLVWKGELEGSGG